MSHSDSHDDDDNTIDDTTTETNTETHDFMPKEAMLELIEGEDGTLLLRDINRKDDPLVSINFSDKIKDMLGEDVHYIGQQMIHAAIQTVMHKQMKSWHAHVHDEEPKHYS